MAYEMLISDWSSYVCSSDLDKFTVKPVMVLQMVEQTSPKFAVCRRRKMRTGFQEMGNFTEDPGPSLSRATNHDSIGAGVVQYVPGLFRCVDVAICNDRHAYRLPDRLDRILF